MKNRLAKKKINYESSPTGAGFVVVFLPSRWCRRRALAQNKVDPDRTR